MRNNEIKKNLSEWTVIMTDKNELRKKYLEFENNTDNNQEQIKSSNIISPKRDRKYLELRKKYLEFENNNTGNNQEQIKSSNIINEESISPEVDQNELRKKYLEYKNKQIKSSSNIINEESISPEVDQKFYYYIFFWYSMYSSLLCRYN